MITFFLQEKAEKKYEIYIYLYIHLHLRETIGSKTEAHLHTHSHTQHGDVSAEDFSAVNVLYIFTLSSASRRRLRQAGVIAAAP